MILLPIIHQSPYHRHIKIKITVYSFRVSLECLLHCWTSFHRQLCCISMRKEVKRSNEDVYDRLSWKEEGEIRIERTSQFPFFSRDQLALFSLFHAFLKWFLVLLLLKRYQCVISWWPGDVKQRRLAGYPIRPGTSRLHSEIFLIFSDLSCRKHNFHGQFKV